MASAQIGALRVALSLDSAQFHTGLKQAQSGLARFQKMSGLAFGALAAGATAAAGTLAIAVKRAADHADTLSKTAQKIGVSVEALSRLEHAAKLSDVSLETLSTGLGKLSQNLFEVASGRGAQAKTSFDALGISVKDAAGNLKSADAVLAEVADRFGRMEDGSVKTALAMNLFGRSGRELIPLLNEGALGLKGMADEADRLGVTINTRTAKAAEGFNDSLTRIGAAFDGIANKILTQVSPQMESLAETVADPDFQQAVVDLTGFFVDLGNALARAGQFAVELGRVLPKAVAVDDNPQVPGFDDFEAQHMTGWGGALRRLGITGNGGGANQITVLGGDTEEPPFEPIITGLKQATEAIDPFAARFAELEGVLTATHDPFEQMKLDLTDLKTMWENGRISAEQYGEAVRRTNLNAVSSTLGMAGQVVDALGGLFKDNKAFAVASAVINTAEGITKALAQGGMLGFVGAASVAAAGAAQIAAILSANPGSSGAPSAPSVSAPEVPGPDGAGVGTAVNITMQGETFGRQAMQDLFDGLSDALADKGIKFVTSPIGG